MIWSFSFVLLISSPCEGAINSLIVDLKETYPGWSPRVSLDIGANKGLWSSDLRKAYNNTRIIMLEADDQHVSKLESTVKNIGNAKYKIAVMSENDGDTVSFFIGDKYSTGNSMFKENSRLYTNIKPVTKTTVTLDRIIEEEKETGFLKKDIQEIDYIKIDVQGAELMVLKGGIETIRGATFIQFEGSTVEYNAGGACTYEVDDFLRSIGFYLYNHGDPYKHHGLFKTYGLGQWDQLYVRPDSEYLPDKLKRKKANFCGSRVDRIEKRNETEPVSQSTVSIEPSNWMLGFMNGLLSGIVSCFLFNDWKRMKKKKRVI